MTTAARGQITGLPEFVYCGYPRTGSSFLRHCLRAHPDIDFRDAPRFFNVDENYSRGVDYYRGLFADYTGRRRLGEGEVNYLSDESSRFSAPAVIAERIHAVLPEARILICIRNQTDFLLSGFRYWKRSGLSGTFDAYMDGWPEGLVPFARIADYLPNVAQYLSLFGRERVKVLLYEDLAEDAAAFLDAVYTFLEVSTAPTPTILDQVGTYRQINPSPSRRLSRVFDRLNAVRMRSPGVMRFVLPVRLYRFLAALEHRLFPPSPEDSHRELTAAQHQTIVRRYGPGNRQLGELLGVDLAARGYPC